MPILGKKKCHEGHSLVRRETNSGFKVNSMVLYKFGQVYDQGSPYL